MRQSLGGGPALVAGLGLGHLLVAAWNYLREVGAVGTTVGPVLAAGAVSLFGALVCTVGYWLWTSDLAAGSRWVTAAAAVGGSVVAGSMISLSILVRLAEGRPVGEPVFVLSLASSQGALAGSLVGIFYSQAVHEAEAARRRRDQIEFVNSILRHDLVNSMTVIRGRAAMLAEETSERHQEFAQSIVERTDGVLDLAERVSDVVSVMGSDEELERRPVALGPVVENQLAPLTTGAEDITIETAVEETRVLADDLLEEVVGNLLDNAVTHGVGETGGTIRVSTVDRGGRVQLRVADTGPGVPDEKKAKVFERGHSSRGSGFGLYFVRTMVEHYGGSVWVEDNDPTGAVFVVELDRA